MGCIWSGQEESGEFCYRCSCSANNHVIIINHVCEICIRNSTRTNQQFCSSTATRPCYGEYNCSCGHNWSSRLSWSHLYQKCKRCERSVYPHKQRALQKSDITPKGQNVQEHLQDLCQKLGYHCGKVSRINNNIRKT